MGPEHQTDGWLCPPLTAFIATPMICGLNVQHIHKKGREEEIFLALMPEFFQKYHPAKEDTKPPSICAPLRFMSALKVQDLWEEKFQGTKSSRIKKSLIISASIYRWSFAMSYCNWPSFRTKITSLASSNKGGFFQHQKLVPMQAENFALACPTMRFFFQLHSLPVRCTCQLTRQA